MSERYEVYVQGHIGPVWSQWFDNLTVEQLDDGSTRLCGALPDQAALHGLLNKVRDLGMTLLSVQRANDKLTNENDKRRAAGGRQLIDGAQIGRDP